jgi:hypothetical protein
MNPLLLAGLILFTTASVCRILGKTAHKILQGLGIILMIAALISGATFTLPKVIK